MPFHWGEIPRWFAPRQKAIIEEARAYADRQVEDEANAEFDPRELIAQAYIDGCANGWNAAMSRVAETEVDGARTHPENLV